MRLRYLLLGIGNILKLGQYPYPPKAPDSVALHMNTAIRLARSAGLYQNVK